MPEYLDKVAFVSAITGTPSGDELAKSFEFRYIPTSFFVEPGGKVSSSYTGPLGEADMRSRLEELIEQ